jgi:hypothetical protein
MSLTITKLANGSVEVTGGTQPYTLLSSYQVYQANDIDGVRVVSPNAGVVDVFSQSQVDQVVRQDGTTVAISDAATLYSELKEYFFFELSGSGGGGSVTILPPKTVLISTSDWVGTGAPYTYDYAHGLGTKNLFFSYLDNDSGEYIVIDAEAIDDNTTRFSSTSNTINVIAMASIGIGGSSSIPDSNDVTVSSNTTPAPDSQFYAQIYDADIINNLTIEAGVTLTLTRDIFITGILVNNGTITGGDVHVVDKDLILTDLAASWESDLGITEVTGEVDVWTDNIGGLTLNAPTASDRPTYNSSDVTFNGLPSVETVRSTQRYLQSPGVIPISENNATSIYLVIDNIDAVNATKYVMDYGVDSSVNGLRLIDNVLVQYLGQGRGDVGASVQTINRSINKGIFRLDFDCSLSDAQMQLFVNNTQPGLSQSTNSINTSFSDDVLTIGAAHSAGAATFVNCKFGAILMYKNKKNPTQRAEIEQYLNNKFL